MDALIDRRSLFVWFMASLLLVALGDVPNTLTGAYYVAAAILGILVFASVLVPTRIGLPLLIAVLATGRDIVSADGTSGFATASIWQLNIGPIRPSWLIFAVVGGHILRLQTVRVPAHLRVLSLWFLVVPSFTAAYYGGLWTNVASIEVVKDLKYAVMLVAGLVLFLTVFYRRPQVLPHVIAAFFGALLARHGVDLLYVAAGFGPEIAVGVTRGSLDSAKGAAALLGFFGLYRAARGPGRGVGLLIGIAALVLLVAYGTRMLWLTYLMGLPILAYLLGARRGLKVAAAVLLIAAVGLASAQFVAPATLGVATDRARTLTQGRAAENFAVAVDYNFVSRVDPIRYAQVFNVAESLTRKGAWLWGVGYGGFYEDRVFRFPQGLQSTFPEYSFQTGRFYWAHSFVLYSLLKWGILGSTLILMLWLKPANRLRVRLRAWQVPASYQPVAITLLAFLPTAVLQLFWSGKGLVFSGLILALMIWLTEQSPTYSEGRGAGSSPGPPVEVGVGGVD